MKKIIHIAAVALLLLVGSGCEKFLEERPDGLIAPENYFKSASDGKAALTGIYAILKNNSLYGQLGLDAFYGSGADEVGPSRPFGFVNYIQEYTIAEGNADEESQKTGVAVTWKDLYRVVLNTNIIIDRVTGNVGISKKDQDDIIGETLFLRSLAYFHLTTLWGAVPYYRTSLPLVEVNSLPRTEANKIRNEILVDLQKAMDLMPGKVVATENGRATKWAAAMLMTKIYLVQKDWKNARDKSVEIINNSPHKLLANFGDVFSPNREYNEEVIWELDFAKDLYSQYERGVPALAGNGNWYPSMFCPRLADEPLNSADKPLLIAALGKNGESFNGTSGQIPLPDLVKKFPKNDLRRIWTVLEKYEGIQLKFPYMPKMWNLNIATSPRFNHSDNKMIYRLADAYLMAAEAENELNGPANAYQYVNAVRKRAFATAVEANWTGMSKDSFRRAMYDERKWEFAGESHRRFDLIRWGILMETVLATEYRVYNPKPNIKPIHILLPIPPQEFLLNPNLLSSDPTNNGYR